MYCGRYGWMSCLRLLLLMPDIQLAPRKLNKSQSAFWLAVENDNVDGVNAFLVHDGVNFNEIGVTEIQMNMNLLMLAAHVSSLPIIDALLDTGHFDVNEQDKERGYTALMYGMSRATSSSIVEKVHVWPFCCSYDSAFVLS
jgi:hypothetical protein